MKALRPLTAPDEGEQRKRLDPSSARSASAPDACARAGIAAAVVFASLLVFTGATIDVAGAPALLFRAGFGPGTALAPPAGGGRSLLQTVSGSDGTSGFAWPPRILGSQGDGFQLLADADAAPDTVDRYIVNRIAQVPGPDGKSGYALFQQLVGRSGPESRSATQDPYVIHPASAEGDHDLYVSYWLAFPADTATRMPGNGWRAVFEWKTGSTPFSNDGDYRFALYVYTKDGSPYWFAHGDNNAGGAGVAAEYWHAANRSVPVPVGRWFKFAVFWHRSAGADGRFWAAIDGTTILDRRGPNEGARRLPINRIMLFQLYGGGTLPVSQWVDGLEIRDGWPATRTGG